MCNKSRLKFQDDLRCTKNVLARSRHSRKQRFHSSSFRLRAKTLSFVSSAAFRVLLRVGSLFSRTNSSSVNFCICEFLIVVARDHRTCAYQEVRNVSFSEYFATHYSFSYQRLLQLIFVRVEIVEA